MADSGDDPDEPRKDDGLDLARQLTRATAKSSPAARKRRAEAGHPAARRQGLRRPPRRPRPAAPRRPVGRLVADHGWELDLRVRGVFARWAELVGDEVGAHCTPESFADGKLVVRADSTAWATQLKLLAPTVVRRLNEELGRRHRDLIESSGRTSRLAKGRRRTRDSRGPRDTYG